MISSYTRAHNRCQVRPCVRLEVVGPRVVALLRPCPAAEQDDPVGLRVVRHRVTVAGGRRSGHVCPRIRPEVVGPSLVGVPSATHSPAEQDHPIGRRVVRQRGTISAERTRGGGHVGPDVPVEVVRPGVVETPAEQDDAIGLRVVRKRVAPSPRRLDDRVRVRPSVRVEVVRPGVVVAAIPTEQNDSVGLGIVRHRGGFSEPGRHRRVHGRPCARIEVVRPGVSEGDTPLGIAVAAEQDHTVGLGIVRHNMEGSGKRTRCGGHLVPSIRVEVVRPGVVEESVTVGRAAEQYNAVRLRVVRHRMVVSSGRRNGRGHVRPRARVEVVGPCVVDKDKDTATARPTAE